MTSKIRPAILKKITSTLDNTLNQINSYDFIIDSKNGQVIITYHYKPETFFKFSFQNQVEEYTKKVEYNANTRNAALALYGTSEIKTKEVVKQDFNIQGTMSPGGLSTEEQFDLYGLIDLQKKLGNWINYIWEDLSADPAIRSFQDKQTELLEFLKQYNFDAIPNGDDHFSKEEIEMIKQKLDAIEESFKKKLNEAIEDKNQLKSELNELKREFETFKQTILNLTKKNWIKATITKLFVWGSKKENQELLKAAVNCGKSLLENSK
ncbi:MAG TPA: hypothetical protein VK151_08810 [Fluviicola sp.]|nr:hypothetical protein [Fluviicola sp.]